MFSRRPFVAKGVACIMEAKEHKSLPVTTADLSRTGISILAPRYIALGSEILLHIDANQAILKLLGTVIACELEEAPQHRVGINFTYVPRKGSNMKPPPLFVQFEQFLSNQKLMNQTKGEWII